MPEKPNREEVLQTYSLRDLLELVEEKSKMDTQEVINNIRQNLPTIINFDFGGIEENVPAQRSTLTPQTKRSTRTKGGRKGRGRQAEGSSLGAYIQNVVGETPMSVEEIMEEVKKLGWNSAAADPRGILYTELGKQVSKGNLTKVGRGQYAKS